MKRAPCLLLLCFWCVQAQSDSKPAPVKTVTVTGCIYEGVECLILKDSKNKQDYSVARINRLQIGHSYKITGPTSTMGMCQEGKPILDPQRIKELNMKCDAPAKP
jgi:hypothetical protein